jgi:hypothetical protein
MTNIFLTPRFQPNSMPIITALNDMICLYIKKFPYYVAYYIDLQTLMTVINIGMYHYVYEDGEPNQLYDVYSAARIRFGSVHYPRLWNGNKLLQ